MLVKLVLGRFRRVRGPVSPRRELSPNPRSVQAYETSTRAKGARVFPAWRFDTDTLLPTARGVMAPTGPQWAAGSNAINRVVPESWRANLREALMGRRSYNIGAPNALPLRSAIL